jgi:cysteinyl-tRNA synthetase
MSSTYLGQTFDIHGGGKDLVFPHHENEIAQSEGASGKTFARYWVHNGFVNINKEKMSKSLGNFLTIKDVLKAYHPEAVRLFLVSSHYRSPIDFSDKTISEAGSGLDRIYSLLRRIEDENKENITQKNTESSDYWNRFCNAMDDDFNTAKGLGTLFEAVHDTNRLMDNEYSQDIIAKVRNDILKMGQILGILNESPNNYFLNKRANALKKDKLNPELIEKKIQERSEARNKKDWATADRIRKELEEMNVILEDRSEGTLWKIET